MGIFYVKLNEATKSFFYLKNFLLLLTITALLGCSLFGLRRSDPALQAHAEFTNKETMLIVQKLTPGEIVKRFGTPDRTSTLMMGTETESPWRALKYEYNMGRHPKGLYQTIDNTNRFYFDIELNSLAFWEIELSYQEETTAKTGVYYAEIDFWWGKYAGDAEMGLPNGMGEAVLNNGLIYEGQWLNGERTGTGINFYKSGAKYEGDF